MTRRDYVLLSAALRRARDADFTSVEFQAGVRWAAAEVARALAEHNPHFDPARFMRDAGVQT